MRRLPFRAAILVLAAVSLIGWVAPAGRVQPRPVEVSEVDDAPEGEVVIEPAQLRMVLAPATAELAELRVVNGGERDVSLSVAVVPVGAGADGAPVIGGASEEAEGSEEAEEPEGEGDGSPDGAAVEEVPSAAEWFALPEDEVHLGPSEAAAFRPAVTVPEGTDPGGYVAAVRFTGDGFQVAALVLVVVPGSEGAGEAGDLGDVQVSLRRVTNTRAQAEVALDAGSVGAFGVEGSVEVRAWYGRTIADVELPPTVVLPGAPRVRSITFRSPVIPGPYTVSVDGVAADAPSVGDGGPIEVTFGTASDRAWLWNPGAVIALAVLLLVVTGWLLWRATLR